MCSVVSYATWYGKKKRKKKKEVSHTLSLVPSQNAVLYLLKGGMSKNLSIYIYKIYFLETQAALRLHCCARAFSSYREQALFSSCSCIARALGHVGFSGCGMWA